MSETLLEAYDDESPKQSSKHCSLSSFVAASVRDGPSTWGVILGFGTSGMMFVVGPSSSVLGVPLLFSVLRKNGKNNSTYKKSFQSSLLENI